MQFHNRKRAVFFAFASAAWIAVLFFFSGQSGQDSGALSQWLTRRLLGWLVRRGVSFDMLHILVRKCAHFGVFAVEGFFLGMTGLSLMRARAAVPAATAAGACLAVLNELHQTLSEGRACSEMDMLIDSCGALTGVLFALVILHAFSIYKKYRYTGDLK